MEIKPETIAFFSVFCTLAGILLTGIFSIITNYLNKLSDERKHYRELIINLALEHWKKNHELAEKYGGTVESLVFFVTQMVVFCEKMLNRKLNPEKVEKAFNEYDKIVERIRKLHRSEKKKDFSNK